jgi:hypothetical protein
MDKNHNNVTPKAPNQPNEPENQVTKDWETWTGELSIDPYTVQNILDANDVVEEWQNEQS